MTYIELTSVPSLGSLKGKSVLNLVLKLKKLSTLKLIELEFDEEDISYINQAWYVEESLEELHFSGNSLPEESKQSILSSISNLSRLKVLHLEKFGLNSSNCEFIYEALSQLVNLEELYLANNSLNRCIPGISAVIKSNSKLCLICMNNCSLDDVDFSALDDILIENTTVERLYLNMNEIGDRSVGTVRNLLEGNSTIKELYLLRNKIRMFHLEEVMEKKHKHRVVMEY